MLLPESCGPYSIRFFKNVNCYLTKAPCKFHFERYATVAAAEYAAENVLDTMRRAYGPGVVYCIYDGVYRDVSRPAPEPMLSLVARREHFHRR